MSAENDSGMHMGALQPQPRSYDPAMQPQLHMVASNLANGHANIASNHHTPALQTFSNGHPRGVGLVSPSALPPASANATQLARKRRMKMAGPGVNGFNPEIITIQVGEDIVWKIMSSFGNGWATLIMSANGALSNVTLRHRASSHETFIYEGYFEIISLSGSYQPQETGGMCSHRGGLGVSLAGLNGCVFGGGVAGPLIAASPVQVVIGRFPVDDKKKIKQVVTSGIPSASSSTLGGAPNGSTGMHA